MTELTLKSKAFRDGGMVRLMDFAVRGLPRTFIPGEQRIDVDWAKGIYTHEILQLDELGIQSQWFWSGITGAALISLVVWPQTIELWRQYTNLEVSRDDEGADAACLLFELTYRHQNDERLTRNPEFQLYVFQSALAVAQAWVQHDQQFHRYRDIPPVPDVLELIDRVRKHNGQGHERTGFRPTALLREHWYEPEPPETTHRAGVRNGLALAQQVIALEPEGPSARRLDTAARWIRTQNPLAELAHPAAMAAAIVTIAEDDACKAIWMRVFNGLGVRRPNGGRKPISDTSMRIQDAIHMANRSKSPREQAAYLYFRIRQGLSQWKNEPDRLRAWLPRATGARAESEAIFSDSQLAFSPRMKFGGDRPWSPVLSSSTYSIRCKSS